MQTRQSIRDHIDIYRQFYAAGVVVFGFFVLILLGMELRHQKMAEIVNWPITRARIVESSFREVPSGNHGTDTSVVVSLKLSYMVMNHLYECSYTQSWQRSDHSDYAAILAAGKEIDVRYSPSDPQTISLHPITPF